MFLFMCIILYLILGMMFVMIRDNEYRVMSERDRLLSILTWPILMHRDK